jgi:phosphoglycolate phosphatase
MIPIDTLLFDLDGTLVDSKQDIANSVHALQKKYSRPLTPDDEIGRLIGDGMLKLVEGAIGRESPDPIVQEAAEFFKAHYREHALDHSCVYPGAMETLEHFRSKKMAVVTNKPVRISRHIIEALGLGRYFPVVVGGDSTARKKPDPDGLILAMTQLGVSEKSTAVMIGDSVQDIEAGRAAGIKTCGIPSNIADTTALKRSGPDFTINSLPDLKRIID